MYKNRVCCVILNIFYILYLICDLLNFMKGRRAFMDRKSRRLISFIVLVCMLATVIPAFAVDSATESNNSNATLFFSSIEGVGTSSALNYVKGEEGRVKAIEVKRGQTVYFYASLIFLLQIRAINYKT